MFNLAIIPARGGSKRIPRKNIKDFNGKPIIAYSIEAAIAAGIFAEIMVSTDDEEIAEVAIEYGAKVPFLRSRETSNDEATTMEVITEVLNTYSKIGRTFERICCIYPTAPFARSTQIKLGLELLIAKNYSCVFPSVNYSYPIWRGFEIEKTDAIRMFWPEHLNSRSQDLKKAFHDVGQWYWFNVKMIENWEWPENSGTIILEEKEVQDIDTPSDWEIAEFKFQYFLKK